MTCKHADGIPNVSGDDSYGADEALGSDAADPEGVPRGPTSAVVPADRAACHLRSALSAKRATAPT